MSHQDNSINFSKLYELGKSQTAEQTAVLENEGITNLENRIQLLGYYSKCQTREDANKWKLLFESLICDNLELGFLGTVAVPQGLSPIAFAGLRDVLLSSLEEKRSAVALANAGSIIGSRDSETGTRLLEDALLISPLRADWARKIVNIWAEQCAVSYGKTKREYFEFLYTSLLRYLRVEQHVATKFAKITTGCLIALAVNESEKAELLSKRALNCSKEIMAFRPKAYGLAGLVAIQTGNIQKARQYLLQQLELDTGFFEMNLANELLAYGEDKTVLRYLEGIEIEITKSELPPSPKLHDWIRQIRLGEKPVLTQFNIHLD